MDKIKIYFDQENEKPISEKFWMFPFSQLEMIIPPIVCAQNSFYLKRLVNSSSVAFWN